jgi:hypothetical protein
MAIQGNGSNGYLTRNAPGINSGSMSVALWFRTPASLSGYKNTFYMEDGSNLFAVQLDGSTLQTSLLLDGEWCGPSYGAASANTWYHVAITCDGSGVALYVNGASIDTEARSYSADAIDFIDFFAWEKGGDWGDGRVAAVKLWGAVLTADEIAAEMTTVRSQRTANLAAFWPMIATALADAYTDYSGNGMTLSSGGTVTVADGPPTGWGAPVLVCGAGSVAAPSYVDGAGQAVASSATSAAGAVVMGSDATAVDGSVTSAAGGVVAGGAAEAEGGL